MTYLNRPSDPDPGEWVNLAIAAVQDPYGNEGGRLEGFAKRCCPHLQHSRELRKVAQMLGSWAELHAAATTGYGDEVRASVMRETGLPPDTAGLMLRDTINRDLPALDPYVAFDWNGARLEQRVRFSGVPVELEPLVSQALQEMSAVRPGQYRFCVQCGRVFRPFRSDAMYCGAACKVASFREKKKEGVK